MGSCGTESTGGFQWRLSGARGAPFQRLKDVSSLPGFPTPHSPPGTPDLRSVYPPSFLKPPPWPLGLKSLDMKEGKKEGRRKEPGALRSRSFYFSEQMGTSATPVLTQ